MINNVYDLICVGGGMSGISVAISAAKQRKRVLLVEKNEFLGGMAVTGIPLMGFTNSLTASSSLAGALVRRVTAKGGGHPITPDGLFCVNPEILKLELLHLCQEAGVEVLFHCVPIAAKVRDGKLASVEFYGKTTQLSLHASCFADATGSGDLCEIAGAEKILKRPALVGYSAVVSDVNWVLLRQYVSRCPQTAYQAGAISVSLECTDDRISDLQEVKQGRGIFLTPTAENSRFCLQFTLPDGIDVTDPETISESSGQAAVDLLWILSVLKQRCPGFENVRLSAAAPMLCAESSVLYEEQKIWRGAGAPFCSKNIRNLLLVGQVSHSIRRNKVGFVPMAQWVVQGEQMQPIQAIFESTFS